MHCFLLLAELLLPLGWGVYTTSPDPQLMGKGPTFLLQEPYPCCQLLDSIFSSPGLVSIGPGFFQHNPVSDYAGELKLHSVCLSVCLSGRSWQSLSRDVL